MNRDAIRSIVQLLPFHKFGRETIGYRRWMSLCSWGLRDWSRGSRESPQRTGGGGRGPWRPPHSFQGPGTRTKSTCHTQLTLLTKMFVLPWAGGTNARTLSVSLSKCDELNCLHKKSFHCPTIYSSKTSVFYLHSFWSDQGSSNLGKRD
jgi:hypothetical protein